MGNICADPASMQRKNSIGGRNNFTTQSKNFPSRNSRDGPRINFDIQTWKNEILPDVRNQQHATKSEYAFINEGLLIFSELKDDILFIPKSDSSKQVLTIQPEFNYNSYPKNILSMKIQKDKKRFQLTFANDFIYELVTSPREIIEGDKILLGGTEYKLVKFIHDPKYGANKVKDLSEIRDPSLVRTNDYMKSFSNIPDENPTCRICLSEQTSKQDPLICPCHCTGSVKYFHLKCWSSWSFSSQISHQGLYIGNVIKEECELCKTNLLKDKHYRQTVAALLSSVARIKTPFIVLQGLRPLEDYPYYRNIKLNFLIISFAEKKSYTVGRLHVDIPIEIDNSISRKNTSIQMKNNKIYIDDIGSKHGTYIRIQPSIVVKDNLPRHYLFNNHLFSIQME